jgi:hypothetical protein
MFRKEADGPVHWLDKGAADIRRCMRTSREIIGN